MWVRPMLQCRQQVGVYNMLMAELRSDDIDMYEGFTPMSFEQFVGNPPYCSLPGALIAVRTLGNVPET